MSHVLIADRDLSKKEVRPVAEAHSPDKDSILLWIYLKDKVYIYFGLKHTFSLVVLRLKRKLLL